MKHVATDQGLVQFICEYELVLEILAEDPKICPARWMSATQVAKISDLSLTSVWKLGVVGDPPGHEGPGRTRIQHPFYRMGLRQRHPRCSNRNYGHGDVLTVLARVIGASP